MSASGGNDLVMGEVVWLLDEAPALACLTAVQDRSEKVTSGEQDG